MLLILAAVAGGVYLWRARENAVDARQNAAQRFASAWAKRDSKAMWEELTPSAQKANPERRFVTAYANADRAAGVKAVRVGPVGQERDGKIAVPVIIRTDIFGRLRGTMQLPVSGKGDAAGVGWNFALRLPGLRADEAVVRRAGREPRRAMITAADGSALDATPIGAAIAGRSGENPTGLERVYDARLGGHPSAKLMFGNRVIARTKSVRGRPVHTTLQPRLMRAANQALGGKLGGVAVIRPRDGAVQALAGLAVSSPQPPGSTFKIITTSAALDHKVATPDTTFRCAARRCCPACNCATPAGSRAAARSRSRSSTPVTPCSRRSAPRSARAGWSRPPRRSASTRSRGSPPPCRTRSRSRRTSRTTSPSAPPRSGRTATSRRRWGWRASARRSRSAARHAQPRVTTLQKVVRRRAVSRSVADQVTEMMKGVVRSGTGTAAALPGVTVAGKTGTAELRPNSSDPKDADAWFVAFAPAEDPRVAVAVMLVGAGFGGKAAAPVAREVLQAALG